MPRIGGERLGSHRQANRGREKIKIKIFGRRVAVALFPVIPGVWGHALSHTHTVVGTLYCGAVWQWCGGGG